MPIQSIDRNAYTRNVSATVTLKPEDYIVVANATSAGFTITLPDWSDGAEHDILIQISSSDSSGNTVALSGNAGAFTQNLASNATNSVWLKTRQDGTWFVAGYQSVTTAAAASSAAASAGLAASTADSKAVSDSVLTSTAQSGVVSASTGLSAATSRDTSQSTLISVADSKAVSDSVTTSTAQSGVVSGSTGLSTLTSRVSSKGG